MGRWSIWLMSTLPACRSECTTPLSLRYWSVIRSCRAISDEQAVAEGAAEEAAEAGVAALERQVEEVVVLERVVDVDDVRVAEALEPAASRATTRP